MSEPEWVKLADPELLKVRLCDLKMTVEDSELSERVSALHAELEAMGLTFRPKAYLGDEWFSPEGVPSIAIPFYLAHPRLKTLEKNMMLEVEGGTPEWCMKLLRHEAGHCFDHIYKFSKRKKWREIFGSPDMEYDPDLYHPRPYSRGFVKHIENWYAQSHPDEDFAETFAVWLTPGLDWKTEYAKWPLALQKLTYVDGLAREVADKPHRPVAFTGSSQPYAVSRMKRTLEAYYARRKRERAQDYPDFYDADLRHIFNGSTDLPKRDSSAARFMNRNRKALIDILREWTGEKKYTIDGLLKKLSLRCEALDLRMGKPEPQTCLEVAAFLSALVTHYLFTGKFKRTL
ncbi:MAG: putative zinc-binding metallopeptidase [Deltaproteobacteria bacterium]|nr:putative zinc-binding metallopeptidase [Deltaproteobacteria bacterium]